MKKEFDRKMSFEELKEFLDFKADFYNNPSFVATDPIQLVHRFERKEDIEIVGLLMSTIAWGNRKAIITSGERILEIMEQAPFEFISEYESFDARFVHRTFNAEDLHAFFLSLKRLYRNGGLEAAFAEHPEHAGAYGRIAHFRSVFTQGDFPDRTQKHIANPLKNSSSKRLNMYLRWMVRNDRKGVDFGIWNSVSPSELHLPLDVHTGNVARKLGLLQRTQNDWKAVAEIQESLVKMDPADPCKYDFALFGLGAFEGF
jgi:uncharacterized protein (TIGR02757 family)